MTGRAADLTADTVDAGTNEGLRVALRSIREHGWDGRPGRAVLAAVGARCVSWAAVVDRRCGYRPGSTDPDDVLTAAWVTLARSTDNVVRAEAPWAYLWTSVGNALAVDNAADALLGGKCLGRGGTRRPAAVIRVGLDTHTLPQASVDDASTDGTVTNGSHSPSVAALVTHLVRAGGDRDFWTDAVDRALEVMAGARRSYEEHSLRRDPYLREELGLTMDELSDLGALLIGPRRGDRASQSLMLRLHRDPAATPDVVAGATARIQRLVARPHRRRGAACTSAA